MDRMADSDSVGVGSIPTGSTKKLKEKKDEIPV